MTILDNLEFHNTSELIAAPGGGLQIARFPERLWSFAEAPMGAESIRSSNGCEIRFVTDKPKLRLYLRSLVDKADLVHLMGNQIYCYQSLEAGKIHCLELVIPGPGPNRKPEILSLGGFSQNVYRIYSTGATLAYHGIDAMGGDVRPPARDEVPRKRWLAYGSSITQSRAAHCNYVNCAAQMLEVDALNLGMGGSCWIENAIADFIAARHDWDFASFELGINMIQSEPDNTQFAAKVDYLLDAVTKVHPTKPLFLITIFNCGMYHECSVSGWGRDLEEKNAILKTAADRFSSVRLIDGLQIAPDFRGFQKDLLHPEPFAYARMGLNLAQAIQAKW